ncbi:CRISPR-associated helicase Cas3' [Providencia stuartii]|uniref:CRISPR-associated helicase Cas3' n=1 Tax=Providencia TaxID=586 RepID=UPI001B63F9E1|nr:MULTISPECIES: CRISPR-associated helicase Cas3' [Providencia]MBQ0457413.1 CRISPR-associated helicase Cas3' [Providencia stuartii]
MLKPKKVTEYKAVPFEQCSAKTYENIEGNKLLGRSVFNHCKIVGEVAKELIKRSPVQHLFPKGAAFTAATHDIGKVSPTFYDKLHAACNLPLLAQVNYENEKQWGGHAGVSQATALALNAPEYIAEILGGHHGFAPDLGGKTAYAEQFGGLSWQKEREKLVVALQEAFQEKWPEIKDYSTARLIAGLTSVADWIGSGEHFDNPHNDWQLKIQQALDEAGFMTPSFQKGLSFEQVFGFPPRETQSKFIEQVSKPGVYVLEAPMGLGKTEAALYAAFKMLESKQASGIYFALPTQLTSNKIYDRFNSFLKDILAPNCAHRTALLLHANAWLMAMEMGEEGSPGGAWFNQAKRGLLAPFAVGTIDQALMAAMNVKHGFVRTFGLAGKVVILDEVHTYDAYTGTLLDALIQLLRELDCTVIILSATLNQERRQALLGVKTNSMAYPLITALPNHAEQVHEIEVTPPISNTLQLQLIKNELLAIEEALKRAEQGQQVLWLENTVKEAQERYLVLAARAQNLGVDCGLLHSRFTFEHRQNIEKKWIDLFGKPGWENGNNTRNKQGRILVGTQVLEQSIDIDADFLVSRFAPTDMLLQRFGRLWRHEKTPRNLQAKQEAWLLVPELEKAIDSPNTAFGASAFVYSPYVLCRSLEVWEKLEQAKLPADIRILIEATYKSREEIGNMAKMLEELKNGSRERKGQNTLQQLARVGLAQAGNTLPESRAQTRYSETDVFEVLLLKGIYYDKEKQAGILTLLNNEQVILPLNRSALSRREWREITAKLISQLVYVRPSEAPKQISRTRLQSLGLHHCFYLGNPNWQQDESVLRIALLAETDELFGFENTQLNDRYTVEYRQDLGYRTIKN